MLSSWYIYWTGETELLIKIWYINYMMTVILFSDHMIFEHILPGTKCQLVVHVLSVCLKQTLLLC